MKDPKDHDPPERKKTNTLDLQRESLQTLSSSQLRGVYGGGHDAPKLDLDKGSLLRY